VSDKSDPFASGVHTQAARQAPCAGGVIPAADVVSSQPADADTWLAASGFLRAIEEKQTATWPVERLTRLVELWLIGLSTREIGLALDCTKNAVVGKAHRLGLPNRASPIIRTGVKPPADRRPIAIPAAVTLAPLASTIAHPPGPFRLVAPVARKPAPTPERGMPAPVRAAAPIPLPPAVFRKLPSRPCCWPFGEPRTESFRFCGGPGVPGRPYCVAHMRKAYKSWEELQCA
jgi:GcrA cell cycle regulator